MGFYGGQGAQMWRGGANRGTPVGSAGDPAIDQLNNSMPHGTEFGNINLGGGRYSSGGGSASYGSFSGSGYGPDAGNANRDRFSNPSDVNASTQADPREDYAYGRARDFEGDIANQTNEETVRELGRFRDDISTGMAREGEAALGRGAGAGFFKARALESGKRDLSNLQARLADVSLGRHQNAIDSMGAAAGRAAEGQRSAHFQGIAARLAENRFSLDQADQQARLEQAPYDRMLKMAETVGRFGSGMTLSGSGGMTASNPHRRGVTSIFG